MSRRRNRPGRYTPPQPARTVEAGLLAHLARQGCTCPEVAVDAAQAPGAGRRLLVVGVGHVSGCPALAKAAAPWN